MTRTCGRSFVRIDKGDDMEKKDEIVVKVPLEVRLTEAELKAAAKELAEASVRKGQLENDIETFKAQKKAEITALEAVIAKNVNLVNAEKEFRLVECRVEYDFGRRGVKTYYRLDNGESVRTEQITNEERQRMMPGIAPSRSGKDKAAGE